MGGGNVNRYIAYGDPVAIPSFLLYCLLSQEGEYNDKMLHEQVHFVGSLSSPGKAHMK